MTRIDSTHSSTGQVSKPLSTQFNNVAPLREAAKPPTVGPGHKRNNSQMSDSETSDMKSSSEEVSSKSQNRKKSHDDNVSSASSSPELGRKKWITSPNDNSGPQAFRLTEEDIKASKKSLIGKQRDAKSKDDAVRSTRSSSVGEHSSDDERDKHKKKKDKKEKKAKEVKDKEKDKERSKSPISIRKMLRSSSSSSIERKAVKKTMSTATITQPATSDVEVSDSADGSGKQRVPQIVMTPSTPPLNLSSGSIAISSNSINSITSALSLDNTPVSSPQHSFDVKKHHVSSDSFSSSVELHKSSGGLSDTADIELEVEDLKMANYIAMSMSRKGTIRTNFANSRARSNSVVASRPGGEILANRKPTTASMYIIYA